ncbi:MAG: hypothetical protein FJ076_04375 [Cyanobacteria bacterium K_DeepCast_35m_m1_288]|nr:hypothetical protein [Cyanobacteria bacterium K_DeepCast_35m_m1_288]
MASPWVINSDVSNLRLRQLLGPATILLHPLYGLGLLLLSCLPLLPFASQPLGLPLAALSTYLLLLAVRIEQSWLAVTPLPPLTVLCFGAWLRCGLGGLLLALGEPASVNEGNYPYWRYLPQTQLLWLLFSGAAVLTFAIWPRHPTVHRIRDTTKAKEAAIPLALTFGIFAIAYISVGAISGTLDRNPSDYLHWVLQRWRPDSLFSMFARFRDLFFLLTPLAIYESRRIWQRLILLMLFTGYFLVCLPLGGRGLVLYPVLYAVFGLWLTPIPVKIQRIIIISSLITSLVAIPGINMYESLLRSDAGTSISFTTRYKALLQAGQNLAASNTVPFLIKRTGLSLYGCSDGYLFQDPARSRPRAGFHRMKATVTAWVPELLVPKKVPVRDAHIIAEEIRGRSRKEAETMYYTTFHCVSFGGDLYWRGGWPIVAVGSALAAIAYRLVSSLWYRHAGWGSVWQILLLLYPATFLTMYPAGSIGETAWLWMWDLPKYVVLIGLICFISSKLPHMPAPTP